MLAPRRASPFLRVKPPLTRIPCFSQFLDVPLPGFCVLLHTRPPVAYAGWLCFGFVLVLPYGEVSQSGRDLTSAR